ncbi:hypothetical protein BsWGS_16423 [Bradybaena similaris]
MHIVTECRCASHNAYLESKYMQKFINKRQGGNSKKTKKKWYQSYAADPMEVFSVKELKDRHAVSRTESARAKRLGHVLYDKITQIINTGELSEELLSKQVFITSVKMTPNFQDIHVCWDSNRDDAAEVEALLHANAGKLRSILISYHVLGRIPVVTFVKDQLHADLSRLNLLFEIADYGPDYVPSSQRDIQRNQLLNKWGMSSETQSSAPSAPTEKNLNDAGFYRPEAEPANEAECSAVDGVVENNDQCSASDTFQSLENDSQSVNLMQGLKFISNVYTLPHGDLMRKVLAQKTKGKCPNDEMMSNKTEAAVEFDANQLKSRMDKIRLQSVAESSKFKQRLLERDYEDFESDDDH